MPSVIRLRSETACVTINAPSQNTNVFTGTIERLTLDTMVVSFRDNRASIALPRVTIRRVEKSAAAGSRLGNLRLASPLFAGIGLFAALPNPAPPAHPHDRRNFAIGYSLATAAFALLHKPRERWVDQFTWLDR